MSKTGSANGSFFGNFIYDQLLRRRPHFLSDLSRAVDFSFVKAALKDFYVDWGRAPLGPGAHVQNGLPAVPLRPLGPGH